MRRSFEGRAPVVHPTAWVAPGAMLVGDVYVGAGASVWFNAVLRADIESVRIGARTNVQDNVTIHVTGGRHPTSVGDGVTIGHGAIVHGCEIGGGSLIGMGAIVMDGAVLGERCLVGAGSLVTPAMRVPPGMLVLGSPARVVRTLSDEEIGELAASADRYVALAARHRAGGAS